MKTLGLGNIEIKFDFEKNKKFYSSQEEFICDCKDCLNYIDKIPIVKKLLNGIDDILGIDLTKAVGQDMDELMPHDYDDHHLYVIPYYINGKCFINGNELIKHKNGYPNEIKLKLSENLNFTIKTSDRIKFDNAESILTIWLEFKTELLKEI